MENEDYDILPDREFALDLLRKLKIPHAVKRHSIKVAEKAVQIAGQIKKKKVNFNLVEIGALLHDIGRTTTHGFKHAVIGGKILRERGFPESLARICETHILGGLDEEDAKTVGLPYKNYLPKTLEEKIVCFADKLIAGRKEVSIESRFNRWHMKFGENRILEKAKKRIEQYKKEIESLK